VNFIERMLQHGDPVMRKVARDLLRTWQPPRIYRHNGREKATLPKRLSSGERRRKRRVVAASRCHNRKRPVRRHRMRVHTSK